MEVFLAKRLVRMEGWLGKEGRRRRGGPAPARSPPAPPRVAPPPHNLAPKPPTLQDYYRAAAQELGRDDFVAALAAEAAPHGGAHERDRRRGRQGAALFAGAD